MGSAGHRAAIIAALRCNGSMGLSLDGCCESRWERTSDRGPNNVALLTGGGPSVEASRFPGSAGDPRNGNSARILSADYLGPFLGSPKKPMSKWDSVSKYALAHRGIRWRVLRLVVCAIARSPWTILDKSSKSRPRPVHDEARIPDRRHHAEHFRPARPRPSRIAISTAIHNVITAYSCFRCAARSVSLSLRRRIRSRRSWASILMFLGNPDISSTAVRSSADFSSS